MGKSKNTPNNSDLGKKDLKDQLIEPNEIHDTSRPNVIITIESKLRYYYEKHIEKLKKKKRWQIPLGCFISTIMSISTSTSTPSLGIAAETWSGFRIISCIIFGVWLAYDVIYALFSTDCDEEAFIDKFKNNKPEIV